MVDGPSSSDGLPALIRTSTNLPATPDAIDLAAAFLAGRSPATLRAYGLDLDDFARFVGAGSRQAATELLISQGNGWANSLALAYRADLQARGLSPATIARRLAALRSLVKLARTLGRIPWTLEVAAPKVEGYRDTRGPGLSGWRRMLAKAEARPDSPGSRRDLAIVRLLHDRGLRRGEAVGLDLADVDLTESTVAILGKGRTQKERLTIGPVMRGALARWIEARGDAPGPLFTRLDGPTGRLTGESVRVIVAAISAEAGLERACRPHGLRHQAITQALDKGRDVRDVAKFSRHKNIQTLMIYDDSRKDVGGDISRLLED